MKIGIDYHGVIETNSEFFRVFLDAFLTINPLSEVHIISGLPCSVLKEKMDAHNIDYTHGFSITDSLLAKGVHHQIDTKTGRPIFPDLDWNTAKARYCEEQGIDLMIDDNEEYLKYFNTPCVLWKRIK